MEALICVFIFMMLVSLGYQVLFYLQKDAGIENYQKWIQRGFEKEKSSSCEVKEEVSLSMSYCPFSF